MQAKLKGAGLGCWLMGRLNEGEESYRLLSANFCKLELMSSAFIYENVYIYIACVLCREINECGE